MSPRNGLPSRSIPPIGVHAVSIVTSRPFILSWLSIAYMASTLLPFQPMVSSSLAGWMANDNPSLHPVVFRLSNISVCSQRLEPLQVHLALVTNQQIHNIS
ncbi:hypothetical protein ZEAMMB73_Zm00001d032977 [Zea mays]|uniref:Uncharacterized protein n=1 Tax=Zea mays TaxID=4577 RepID=A0A1D6KVD2_MAIZE|nr:hypothetical protein ZEAMMB73_Zm00001d032977 [Zea mays]